jgi:hypothetical protein
VNNATHLKRLDKQQDVLLALQEDLELATALEAEADDADDAAAHLVPEVVDVAL